MKLLRYGLNGHIHDLSAELRNISEEVLLPFSLNRLKRLDMNSRPWLRATRASERASDQSENSSASDPQARK
jgi:hypothetical protein